MRDAVGGLPVPRVRRRGREDHAQRPHGVRRAAARQRRAHLDGADRRSTSRSGWRSWPPAGDAARWSTGSALRDRGLCVAGGRAYDVAQQTCSAQGGTLAPGRQRRRLVAAADQRVHPRRDLAHRVQHARAVGARPAARAGLGRVRFLALYLLSGLAGSAAGLLAGVPERSTLGASGAIFGLMGALLVVALKVGGQVQQLLVWIGINFVFTVSVPQHLLAGPPRRLPRRRPRGRDPGLRAARAPDAVAVRRPRRDARAPARGRPGPHRRPDLSRADAVAARAASRRMGREFAERRDWRRARGGFRRLLHRAGCPHLCTYLWRITSLCSLHRSYPQMCRTAGPFRGTQPAVRCGLGRADAARSRGPCRARLTPSGWRR